MRLTAGTRGGWWQQPYPLRPLLQGTAELMGDGTQSESQVRSTERHVAGQASLCHDLGGRWHLESLQVIQGNDHNALSWGVTLCTCVSGSCCVKAELSLDCLIQKMKTLWSVGMSGATNPVMQRHNPEDLSPCKTNCNSTLGDGTQTVVTCD